MRRSFLIALSALLLLVTACGQDGVSSTGTLPPPVVGQPPMPPGGIPQVPPGTPTFMPQMPQGYPPQYTPFLPMDNYFRQQPQIAYIWTQTWTNWQQVAGSYGYSPYDFNAFYYQYLPSTWSYMGLGSLYNYFDSSFYYWMSPQYSFSTSVDYSYFWQYYDYMPFDYSYCGF